MSKYIVIRDFTDLQDKDKNGAYKVYFEGDAYPNPGNKKVTKKRLNELLGTGNKQGKPVIKEIKEEE